jgi:hypothetical protein
LKKRSPFLVSGPRGLLKFIKALQSAYPGWLDFPSDIMRIEELPLTENQGVRTRSLCYQNRPHHFIPPKASPTESKAPAKPLSSRGHRLLRRPHRTGQRRGPSDPGGGPSRMKARLKGTSPHRWPAAWPACGRQTPCPNPFLPGVSENGHRCPMPKDLGRGTHPWRRSAANPRLNGE